jgi:hypothetical protein
MADENQNEIVEENQTEGLMGGVPTEEPKTPDPSETEIPHKEEEKPQEQAEAKEVSRPKSLVTLIVNYKNNSLWVNTKLQKNMM